MRTAAFAAAGCAMLLLAVSLVATPSATKPEVNACNCVAFRLDDIQDYFLSHVQLEAMEVFNKRNVSLTIGVIGNYIGSDPVVVNYLKSRAGDPLLEIANHGWNHEDFTEFDKDEQASLIQRTNEIIVDMLAVRPVVFIAPYNIVNDDTLSAAKESGIRYISANTTFNPPPYNITDNQSLYRLPETALMGTTSADNSYWITFDHQKVFAEVESSLRKHGFAVVTLHPQDFAVRDMLEYQNMVDHDHILKLEMLLDKIKDRDIKVVTISEITLHATQELGGFTESVSSRKVEWISG